jgi:hypothetical protein
MAQAPAGLRLDRRILAHPHTRKRLQERERAKEGFDYPNVVLQGSTQHFNVNYDTDLGADGQMIANGVLASCESEYNTLSFLFGITNPPQQFNIIIAPLDPSGQGSGGAFHYGCNGTDLYIDAKTVPNVDIDYSRMLVVAEEVEVFSDTQGLGWRCDYSNGEGLSRVLAKLLYPAELNGYATAGVWLNSNRPDFITQNDQTDTNFISTGCSVLFLNYLHYQLDFSWPQIVQKGGATLQDTYRNLVNDPNADALTPFLALLQAFFPVGTPVNVPTDNVFPLLSALNLPYCGVQFQGTVPASSTAMWFTYDWPALWDVVWTVVPTSVDSGGPQVECNVQVEKTSGDYLTYWINITNLTQNPVDIEARYCILGD